MNWNRRTLMLILSRLSYIVLIVHIDSRSDVEAIVRHFNPIGSEPLQLSFCQFVRLCSESSTHNFAEDGTCL